MAKLVVGTVSPATSVQDAGRFGAQRYGLTQSGAMDALALACANTLVGNKPFTAAIEVGPLGGAFMARGGALRVALSGAMRQANISARPLPLNESALIADGETLTLTPARTGSFTYLALEGGVRGEPVFGSLSVNMRSGLGAPYPRPLQAGDEIEISAAQSLAQERKLDLPAVPDQPIRVVMGPQDDEFGEARDLFLASDWVISAASDRMGFRLEGPVIKHQGGHNIVSDGTVSGSIQIPGNGQPLVLMPDRGTTGGYPKIATVIGSDLGRIAQTQVGKTIRFKALSIADAHAEARKFAKLIASLPSLLRDAGGSMLDLDALQSANIAGAAVNAMDAATWQPAPADTSTS